MLKTKKFGVEVNKKFNRNILYTFDLCGKLYNISILMSPDEYNFKFYFVTDNKVNLSQGLFARTYRNLDKSPFCKSSLNLIQTHSINNINCYNYLDDDNMIKDFSKCDLELVSQEYMDFNTVEPVYNTFCVYTFMFKEGNQLVDDYKFIYFERKKTLIDNTGKQVIYYRNAGLQLSNSLGLEYFGKKLMKYNIENPGDEIDIDYELDPIISSYN